MTPMRFSLFFAAVLIQSPSGVLAQTCACTPGSEPWSAPLNLVYTFVQGDSEVKWTDGLMSEVDAAAGEYQSALSNAGSARKLTKNTSPQAATDPGVVKFRIVSSIPGGAWGNFEGYQDGNYIDISEASLSQGLPWFQFLVRHELSHPMGFAAGGGTCTSQQSVTADAQPEDNPTTTLTETDQCIIAVRYQRSSDPPPPRDKDWKAGDNCTPIIVQLDGRTLKLTAPEVFFDLAGWGTKTMYSWTEADSLSGFLVYSRNGNGEVNDGRDLFGNSTPLSWTYQGSSAPNGFSALAFFDLPESGGNGDGWIDKYDQIFYDLRLWFDRNHDGISQPEELMPLHECGVEAIELTTHESNRTDAYGNVYHLRARVILDAAHGYATRFAWDVTLAHQ